MKANDNESGSEQLGNAWLQATQWSLILKVARGDTVQAAPAREELCRGYWHAVYGFIRKNGRTAQDAEDLTQDFFVSHLLTRNAFADLDPNIGKFRCFLKTALRNFLKNQHHRSQAQKRNPGEPLVPLDEAERKFVRYATNGMTGELLFDLHWARSMLKGAIERLQAAWEAKGKDGLFRDLKVFLERDPEEGEYGALGEKHHLNREAVKEAASRVRKEYRKAIDEELGQMAASKEEIQEERRYLGEIMRKGLV